MYKRDPTSALSYIRSENETILNLFRREHEMYKDYKSRFVAQLSRLNARGETIALSECKAALLLLHNANIDPSQRVSVLAASSPQEKSLNFKFEPPCLRASVSPSPHSFVPPSLHFSVLPCFCAFVPPSLHCSLPPCHRASVSSCLFDDVLPFRPTFILI